MKSKVCIFTAFILSILFTSCFSNFKTQRETSVTFNLDKETVSKILKSSINNSSSRAAAGTTADFFIDVSLCGDFEQTKTVPVEDEIHVEFTEVPVNSRVYAKAQIFKYTDSQKTEKNVIYRGQSQTIVVRDTGNVLSIKLGVAALTITFDSNGGTQIVQQTVITGDCAQEPANPVKPIDKSKYSRENFAFAGWYTDAELTNAYNFDLPVTDDLTLYAKWLPDFVFVEGKVLYDYQDLGNTVRILDLFVSDHEVTQAEYYAVTNKAPSIHQDENGTASELPVENVTWFDALAYCNLLSIKENLTPCYKINGSFVPLEWGTPNAQTSVTCNAAANGYRIPSEAEWEYIAQKGKRVNTNFSNLAYTQENSGDKTHKVKINLADELCLCDIYGNVAEWCFDIYSATAKTRVIKGGSYQTAAADCTPEARSGLDPLQSNGTTGFRVVRTYVNEFKPLTNKVTFDSNGGSAVDTQIINNGETAVQPGIPVKEGYNFAGWYEQSTGQAFDFATLILQDIVLQARWSAISYTISYDLNGGDSNDPDNPSSYTIESDTILLKPASRTSYNFTGWYNGTEPVEKIITGSTGNVSLTAHWTQCHIVTFDTNGGSTVNSQEVEDQNYATIPAANPTRTGYNFVRWYTTNQNTA